MKDVRSTVMQLSGRWGNTCYNMLCLAVEAARGLPREEFQMKRYVCEPCGYVYDPEEGDPDSGIEPGTAFEDLPDDWVCPWCGLGKDVFVVEA